MDNKIILFLIILIVILICVFGFKIISSDKQKTTDNTEEIKISETIQEESKEIVNSATDKIQSQEVKMFNNSFVAYEGKRKGLEIKAMLNAINMSNSTNQEHQIKIEGVTSVDNINLQDEYTVELVYDENGYINLVKIK